MANKIGFTPELGLGHDNSLVVELAIVPEHVHTLSDGMCPHCESLREAEVKTYIHDTEGLETMMVVMGDLLKCVDCSGLSLVMEFPKIDYDDFIMTRWTIPEHLRAGM